MEDTLARYSTAKLAEQKGFDWECYKVYVKGHKEAYWEDALPFDLEDEKKIPAPTQSLLQKWLREKHEIHLRVTPWVGDDNRTKYDYDMYSDLVQEEHLEDEECDKYEHSLENGLVAGLNLLPDA